MNTKSPIFFSSYDCIIASWNYFWVLFTTLLCYLWYRDKKITLKVLGSQGRVGCVYNNRIHKNAYSRLSIGFFMGVQTWDWPYARIHTLTVTYTFDNHPVCTKIFCFPLFSRLSKVLSGRKTFQHFVTSQSVIVNFLSWADFLEFLFRFCVFLLSQGWFHLA